MFSKSIDKKPLYTRPDGVTLRDLTTSMFNINMTTYIKYNIYKVPKEFEMRPDLISGAVYNNTMYAEVILKYNGISNPFTIKENDIILIPDLDSMQAIMTKASGSQTSIASAIRNTYRYIDPIKIPTQDSTFKNRQIIRNAENSLPPNIADEGEQQITYRNGRVYFGQGVETCLENGMTQSEFLTTIIKNRKNNK
ncbi:hypothetical protein M0Q50_07130 [bacterium]|jgi:hypothetical protein|nr:hypothetical protein [bacterium]